MAQLRALQEESDENRLSHRPPPRLSWPSRCPGPPRTAFALEVSRWPPDNTATKVHPDVAHLTAAKADESSRSLPSTAWLSRASPVREPPPPAARQAIPSTCSRSSTPPSLRGQDRQSLYRPQSGADPGREPATGQRGLYPHPGHVARRPPGHRELPHARLAVRGAGRQRRLPPPSGTVFGLLPHAHLGLNLDPSHLLWLGVDYPGLVPEYADRIFHVHAKDTEILDAIWPTRVSAPSPAGGATACPAGATWNGARSSRA